jgi:3'(2'), 5'-bisphosphate nucleotidase
MDDHELAAEAARRAGELLLELRASGASGADGDRKADDLILPFLRAERPADAILSEESKDDPARLVSSRVWIVDPLDGTREYGEEGRTDWAVHVALVVDHVPVAAAVALPAEGRVLTTKPAPNLAAATGGPIRLLVSRTRPPELATRLAEILDAELVPMGSAGAKATAVVLGRGDVYAHGGGQYEWDSAAPVGVAAAAGCHTSRLDGAPLRYNQPDPYLPDLLVCRPELADRVLAAIAQASTA